MRSHRIIGWVVFGACVVAGAADLPGPIEGGYYLPNRWKITPVGKSVKTEDLILNMSSSLDGKIMVAIHGGFNPHGLVVLDGKSRDVLQKIPLPTAWLGLAWNPTGDYLYVSGGNAKNDIQAPIYVFAYKNGKLSDAPVTTLVDDIPSSEIFWSGLIHHPTKNLLYAANRTRNRITVFDTTTGKAVQQIATEVAPYDLALTRDGKTLYCSNWASDSVSVVDTETCAVTSTIAVGDNPNDLVLTEDGRLFVCCSNDNTVLVIDIAKGRVVETIVTSMFPQAPEGSTPNALAVDPEEETLFVANADNNNVCVVDIEEAGECAVLGFIPAGWYPSAVAVNKHGDTLFIGNAKGSGSYSNIRGPHSPLPPGIEGNGTIKSLMKGSISTVDIAQYRRMLRKLTKQAYENCPYNDDLLARAKPPTSGATAIPSTVGGSSPIKHVIYIIKENRTYDQVFGDLPQGNGDPRLTIFGREITPNAHAIAEQFVLLDNMYCDAEVSVDGHQWSNAAYATDFAEKNWPAEYGGKSDSPVTLAYLPSSGYLWDQCAKKGLTYRNYGEFAGRQSEKEPMTGVMGLANLQGHVAPNYLSWDARDVDNAAEFIREFDEFERHYDDANPANRLPQLIVLALPEDHTRGTTPGAPTPKAAVASNDYALGMIVDRISHSKYWPETAIFTIQDDAQDGPDHVDARRTVSMVISPYCKRCVVDNTFYTTCSILRTIELILGLRPMSQYDAAATPMYASFAATPDLTPFSHLKPLIDIQELNVKTAWGAEQSLKMNFAEYDLAPMHELNEILWKSMKGVDSEMPSPVHRFQFASLYNR